MQLVDVVSSRRDGVDAVKRVVADIGAIVVLTSVRRAVCALNGLSRVKRSGIHARFHVIRAHTAWRAAVFAGLCLVE